MTSDKYYIKQKQIYFKAYNELSKLEKAMKHLKEESTSLFQVSILGKVNQFCSDKDMMSSKDTTVIRSYWKDILGKTVNFGIFYNPKSGFIFIVGPLVTTFLHRINGKPLATLSSGSYSVFRGIGASDAQATTYLKQLNSGSYLLIFRGDKNEFGFL